LNEAHSIYESFHPNKTPEEVRLMPFYDVYLIQYIRAVRFINELKNKEEKEAQESIKEGDLKPFE
jgi:hypothetical protein